jgi:serine/threonine-protein kinase/endoribonuclease IRE1
MSRRHSGAQIVSIRRLGTCLLFLPLILASPQQEQELFRNSIREHESAGRQQKASSSGVRRQEASILDSIRYKHVKDTTVQQSNGASAIATLAPAGNAAVRAPKSAQEPGKAAGPSTLINARSLQDWEVEDFVLLATVDGSIHARDRHTGAERWNLEVDRPMVETIYHRQNNSGIQEHRPEDDFLWIVEPSRDGDIYIFDQGRNIGLQRPQLTVKQLAQDFSPYAGEDPAVVYTTEKRTTLYTVDAATGIITKTFSSSGSSGSADTSCKRINRLEGEGQECGSNGSIMLGRTEYTVNIEHLESEGPICTLKYSEWGPNNRDMDLQGQYSRTMDQKYVFPRFDGSIWGFDIDYGKGSRDMMRKRYVTKLPSPVVRVFDVVRPAGSQNQDTQLVLLPQPPSPQIDISEAYPDRNRIFVNKTEGGGWYAMSEMTYPFSTGGAAKASFYNHDWLGDTFTTEILPLDQRQQSLVGVHSLTDRPARGLASEVLTLPGPSTEFESNNLTPVGVGMDARAQQDPSLQTGGLLPNPWRTQNAAANTLIQFAVAIFLMFLGAFFTMNHRHLLRVLRKRREIQKVLGFVERQLDSVPSSPIAQQVNFREIETPILMDPEELSGKEDGEATPTVVKTTLLEPSRSRSSTITEDRGRTKEGPRVKIVEPSPSPGPPRQDDDTTELPTPKKKARRGTRGGTKHKKKKGSLNKPDEVEQTVEEVLQIAKTPTTLEPDVLEVSGSSPADVSGPIIRIGHLKVFTDTTIGFGSHGTVVYKGQFGGRDVAVKRMLLEFYDIASHEVGLLQESDDHPNVIRYYDKESAGQFLYIALELCPCSLQDMIEKPYEYSELIGPRGLDLPDVLRQITAGLRYLHSLKIVHRDIKPQNILVSAPKRLPSNPNLWQPPRLLISDFGLCKKLEGDQSSFRATTAHAAGTTGWRAPELLIDDDAVSTNTNGASTSSIPTSTTSDSEPLVLDTQTNRRATRAIDIFSLGCVFYFVLTGGSHPFDRDGRYMREANVVKGHFSLDELAKLGDYQWEARDLISSMIQHNPKARPDAATVLMHPFFWNAQTRLDFLCSVSDAFEFEPRDPPSPALQTLESLAPSLLREYGNDFLRPLPQAFKDTLGKQRKYVGSRMLDLLRALRNKKNHYEDMPDSVKKTVGSLPEGYLGFWTRKFPGLLMGCHAVVQEVGWQERDRFRTYYYN